MRYKKTDLIQISIRVPKQYKTAIERCARRTNRYFVQVIKDGVMKECSVEDFQDGKRK